jgi:hypothetical protein
MRTKILNLSKKNSGVPKKDVYNEVFNQMF